jgi:hypothetical protein
LAGIVARKIKTSDIVMIAENGQLAIHLPLTAARISAFSTHTAHPEFLAVMNGILDKALSYHFDIYNPFLYMTKAEVIASALVKDLDLIEFIVSCWRSSRLPAGQTHCGTCIPCQVRRIANEYNEVFLDEYGADIFSQNISSLEWDNDGKKNFIELAEFIRFFEKANSSAEILTEYPELINEQIDLKKAIAMYRRFAKEARHVLNRYPHLSGLLS